MDKVINMDDKKESSQQSFNFFSTSPPKNAVSGFFSGLGNITKGVLSGVCGIIACPIYLGKQEGGVGVVKGLGLGSVLAIVLPIGGTMLGLTQIVRGIYNTPEAIKATLNNKVWDAETKKWIYYSIEEELKIVNLEDESKFKSNKTTDTDQNTSIKELDYYNVLNMIPTATQSEIKHSYYSLAKETHPDKNESDGEKFKLINEAYQVLGNEGLRQKYNKYGKEGVKDVPLVDSEAFYNLLFGTDELKFYIGEIIIYTLMTIDTDNEFIGELLKLKQRKREIEVASNILILLKQYVNNEHSEDYYKTIKSNLNNNPFSNMLLGIIGTVYTEIGESYLGNVNGFINSFKTTKRGITYKYRIFSSYLGNKGSDNKGNDGDNKGTDGDNKGTINIILNTVLMDVENTIKTACYKIFNDCTLDKNDKKKYAKGLIYIGSIFKQSSQSINETRNFLELVF